MKGFNHRLDCPLTTKDCRCPYPPSPMRADGGTDPFAWAEERGGYDGTMPTMVEEIVATGQLVQWVAMLVAREMEQPIKRMRDAIAAVEEQEADAIVAIGPPPDPTPKPLLALTPAESLRATEDRAQEIMGDLPQSVLLVIYKLMYAQGTRITTIDGDIKRAIVQEEGEG